MTEITPAGARLHAGRSRNDQVALDLRLYCRAAASALTAAIAELVDALAAKAADHAAWLMPGYTHLQRAQPVTVGHHLLAHAEPLLRDADRVRHAYEAADAMPLGSGALAATTLPLLRELVAKELGFKGLTANSMDAVADRDFALDLVYACVCLSIHLSRLGEDVVLWASPEFGFVKLADEVATGSSLMPQKKNPDVAELLRGRSGRAVGSLVALASVLKGLPLAYDRDLQEDKPAVFAAVDTSRIRPRAPCGCRRRSRPAGDRRGRGPRAGRNALSCGASSCRPRLSGRKARSALERGRLPAQAKPAGWSPSSPGGLPLNGRPPPGGRPAGLEQGTPTSPSPVEFRPVLLAVDVGNTNVTFGLFEGESLAADWRVTSHRERTADEMAVEMRQLFELRGYDLSVVDGVVISSVVPTLNPALIEASRRYLKCEPVMVGTGVKTSVRVRYENPRDVGADRIANALAAYTKYGGPVVVIDFGTAVTYDAINAQGDYLGGAIAPGVEISLDALVSHTAMLRRVEPVAPDSVIGRNTIASIQSGLFWGFVAQVEGMVKRMVAELGGSARVVATGGQAALVAGLTHVIETTDPLLTLEGLRLIYLQNTDGASTRVDR